MSGARQFLLGTYKYLSDLPPCLFNKGDSALCDDQKTTLAFCVAAKIVAMKVLELVGYQKSPSVSRNNKSLNELLTSISDSPFK